jgi:hypothetical protein
MIHPDNTTLFYIDGAEPLKVDQLTKTKLVLAKSIVVKRGTRMGAIRMKYILAHYRDKITFKVKGV